MGLPVFSLTLESTFIKNGGLSTVKKNNLMEFPGGFYRKYFKCDFNVR